MGIRSRIAEAMYKTLGGSEAIANLNVLGGMLKNPPKKGTKDILQAYSTMPWLRAITNKISRSVASAEWRIYAQKRNGKTVRNAKMQTMDMANRHKAISKLKKSGELIEIEEHPLLDVLNNGNEALTGLSNMQVLSIHIDLVGEGFMMKERNAVGMVVKLWPIPPHWIRSVPRTSNDVYKISFGGVQADVPYNDIIKFTDPDPYDPYGRGSGIARSLADELDTDEYAAVHTKKWFFNSARPDIIVAAEGLGKDGTQRLEEAWLNKHQSFMRSFKPFFMSGKGLTIKELNQSFKNMQLVELRKFERDTIIQVYGVPPEMLGIIESSNRATIESADLLFTKFVVLPRIEFQRTVLQMLAMEYDPRIILDFENPVQEDKEHKLKVMEAMPMAFKIDEWREAAGEEPLPNNEGNVYPVNNMAFVTGSLTDAGADGSPVSPTSTGSEITEDDITDGEDSVKHIPKKKTMQDLSPEDNALITRVLNALKAKVQIDALVPVIRNTVSSFGERSLTNIGSDSSFIIDDPAVTDFLTTRSSTRITNLVNNTTRKSIQRALVDGLSQGETIDSLTTRVRNVFSDASQRRAKIIARTETVRAANFGSNEGMRQGGVGIKEWLSSRDDVVRDSHAPGTGIDGQKVDISSNFKSPISGAEGPYPGELGLASEDVQCRCTIVPVFDEKSAMTESQKTAYWKSFENDRKPYEKAMFTAAQEAFVKQEEDVLNALNN